MLGGSKFEVKPDEVAQEVKFYDKAAHVYDDLERCKANLLEQQREFETLFEYYVRNRGHLDLDHKSTMRPGAEQPNLGTADPSWYYVDERGNKIWIRNLTLDTAKAQSYGGAGTTFTGAFEETQYSDGRHVVVKVPNPKRHYGLQADYRRRCVEAETEWAMRTGSTNIPGVEAAAVSTGWSASPYGSTRRSRVGFEGTTRGATHHAPSDEYDAAYEAAQRHFLQTVHVDSAGRTFRPPATIDEAEQRMAELKAEEQRILKQMSRSVATAL